MLAHPDRARDQQLEIIALLLEEVARKLRLLKVTEAPTPKPSLHVGQRVRSISKAGKYQGRTGVLLSRRGRMFWNLRLDASLTDVARNVFMMETSLRALDG